MSALFRYGVPNHYNSISIDRKTAKDVTCHDMTSHQCDMSAVNDCVILNFNISQDIYFILQLSIHMCARLQARLEIDSEK